MNFTSNLYHNVLDTLNINLLPAFKGFVKILEDYCITCFYNAQWHRKVNWCVNVWFCHG